MSRSGYSDDCDYDIRSIQYRSAVNRAMRGARGQHFLRKLRDALDAMPVKRLITNEISNKAGDVCALGSVDPASAVDPEDCEAVAAHFGIARSMAAEIAYMNDEAILWRRRDETREQRWERMRAWVNQQIVPYDSEVSPHGG